MSASTQILTDLRSVRTTGPSATTESNAIAAAGPITDAKGMIDLAVVKAQELYLILDQLIAVCDSGDSIKTTLTNCKSSIS